MATRPLRTRVKICGLCSADDARAAARAGADALGVILVPGARRRVTSEEAAAVLADAPPFVARVGVFVDASADEIAEAVERIGLTHVQLHGAETPAFCAAMPVPAIKVFRVGPGFATSVLEPYRGAVTAILLDTLVEGEHGGTGHAFAWADLPELPDLAPVIVAGGLTPDSVGAAVRTLRPFAVDVSSGVEASMRVKDHDRIAAFVRAVRAADSEETTAP
ncbi:MAG: phosphoribosylanthranilate isomerase [Coriobacteriia bacterium]|nr:phosphoribosylanthranilate isomerase [Coriobacteriia bacterium]